VARTPTIRETHHQTTVAAAAAAERGRPLYIHIYIHRIREPFVPSYRQLSTRTLPIHLGGPSVK